MGGDIYLHAGAHRTGTSSFQMCLHENRTQLTGAGFLLAYPGRDGVPSGTLALRLPASRHGPRAVAEFAKRIALQFANLPKPLILSEENIPGQMGPFRRGRFYPVAERRFDTLRRGLGDVVLRRVVYVVRSYDELFVSGFRKRAEDNPVDRFDTVRDRMARFDRGWPEIVAAMRDGLRPASLVVLPYEARGDSAGLLRRLVPQTEGLDLVEPATRVNPSATDAALETLQSRYQAGERLSRDAWQEIIAAHADDTAPRGFAAFTAEQAGALKARYAADLARLRDMPGVTVIDPPSRPS